jgi:hypothetical protein
MSVANRAQSTTEHNKADEVPQNSRNLMVFLSAIAGKHQEVGPSTRVGTNIYAAHLAAIRGVRRDVV